MSDTKIPAWAVESARELHERITGNPGTAEDFGLLERGAKQKIADIIAKHAPRPMRLRWERKQTDDPAAFRQEAKSPFQIDYAIWRSGMSDIYFMNGSAYKSIYEAECAAQADFAARLEKCTEAGDAE